MLDSGFKLGTSLKPRARFLPRVQMPSGEDCRDPRRQPAEGKGGTVELASEEDRAEVVTSRSLALLCRRK